MNSGLPIDAAIPPLLDALRDSGRAVLQAPPGAGKTTVVPLALLRAGLTEGRILMLEPRRLAARAAAERMAQSLGESVGATVGYRIRGEARVSRDTRIEVVTEGILTRMIQSDPELHGVGVVIFDEFHERSLNADLGLALCLEISGALREDLILIAMSATLESAPLAALMEAPMITSEGRAFPVETRWLSEPLGKQRLETSCADLVLKAARENKGGVLVFLPGEGEIRRVQALLDGRLPEDCALRPLFGAMDFAAQRAAIAPVAKGRKVVLATAIAETSLTIEDIRVVVDAGRARRARFDAASGMSRLVTEKLSKAEAVQRAGRAGRVAPGVCYRLWTRGEEGALAAQPPAEIEAADLSPLALELALWGARPEELAFLTPPNPGVYAEAQNLLQMLGALDASRRITDHGRKLAGLPLHPRLAHMLAVGGRPSALTAALLAERDPLSRGAPVDLSLRIEALTDFRRYSETRVWAANRGALERIRQEAKRLARLMPEGQTPDLSLAQQVALAYPDRVALRRKGEAPRYVMAGGKGAVLSEEDLLAGARMLVVSDLDGDPREARIRQAALIPEAELRALFADKIAWHDLCIWSRRDQRILMRRQEQFGALVLNDRNWKDPPEETIARAMLDGVRELGLRPDAAAKRFLARLHLVGQEAGNAADFSEYALMERLEDWLLPYLGGVTTAEQWKRFDLLGPLRGMLDWEQMQRLDQLAPAHFTTPLGRKIAIDYGGEQPEISLRLQEMFGQTRHPMIGTTPLRVTLLSPAGRPVQTTQDIPGFWENSYADVRRDMRGRYPRHPWPEDPTSADPTLRAKPRGS